MNDQFVIAVEDSPDLRLLWEVKFEHYGVPGLILTPEEALVLKPKDWKKADILVTDWMMGEYTGADIIMAALEYNPSIRCHVLTALPWVDNLPIGVMLWIKPIPIDTILQEARQNG